MVRTFLQWVYPYNNKRSYILRYSRYMHYNWIICRLSVERVHYDINKICMNDPSLLWAGYTGKKR